MQGKLIYLIPAKVEDAEKMLKAMRPEATQNLSFFEEKPDLVRQMKYLERMTESQNDHLFCVMANGRLVGTVGLHECDYFNRNARIGTLIFNPDTRGRGYGTKAIRLVIEYAFKKLDLRKVYVNLLADNQRRQSYFQRLGFRQEGYLEKEYFLRGEYLDMIRFRLFKEEWKKFQGGE
jgi:RimJ/RimL family protein N-acetyltransferase